MPEPKIDCVRKNLKNEFEKIMNKLKSTLRTTVFARLACWVLSGLLVSQSFAANAEQIRTVGPLFGSYLRVVKTEKQQFYVKAFCLAFNSKATPTSQAFSLPGSWKTVEEATEALIKTLPGGWTPGPVSTEIGPEVTITGPTQRDEVSKYDHSLAVKSVEKTNARIALDAKDGWSLKEWFPEPPPKCEVSGNSTGPTASRVPRTDTQLLINYLTETEFSWSAMWKETKPADK